MCVRKVLGGKKMGSLLYQDNMYIVIPLHHQAWEF